MNRRSLCRRLVGLGTVALAGCLEAAPETDTEPAGGEAVGATDGPTEGTADSAPTSSAAESPTESATDNEPTATIEPSRAWPTFGANDANTGYRPNGVGPSDGTVEWSAIGDAPTVLCPPTVADGVVYTGSAADAVYAFDVESGEELWTFETTSYVETAPTVADGRVYTADADGVVYALTTGGEEVWRHDTEQNFHSRTLAVRDDAVYVGTAGDMPMVVSGDTDRSKAGKVVALDAESGAERWSFEGPEDWFTGPAFADGRVYVGNHTGEVFALEAGSGEAVWSRSATAAADDSAAVLVPPTVADGTVYVAVHAAGRLVALDAATGDTEWSTDLDLGNVKSSPAVTDDRVYLGAYGYRGASLTLDDGEGATAAATSTPERGPAGRLFALDRADGSEVWTHETDRDFRSSPAVVGDRVYVGSGDGALAVAREDGTEQWRVTFDDYVDSSPAVADGNLFIGSADGSLYCVTDE
ncbi:outer membrane protein assembly factor BamB family protein [Halosimplex sp. J119]